MWEHPEQVESELVHKLVQITLRSGLSESGVLHAFDPLSKCVALISFADQNRATSIQVKLIPSHAIDRLSIMTDRISADQRLKIEQTFGRPNDHASMSDRAQENVDTVRQRKERIVRCLTRHLVPYKDTEDHLQIGSAFRIRPPFRKEDCECANEIVLKRTLDLLRNEFDS